MNTVKNISNEARHFLPDNIFMGKKAKEQKKVPADETTVFDKKVQYLITEIENMICFNDPHYDKYHDIKTTHLIKGNVSDKEFRILNAIYFKLLRSS